MYWSQKNDISIYNIPWLLKVLGKEANVQLLGFIESQYIFEDE